MEAAPDPEVVDERDTGDAERAQRRQPGVAAQCRSTRQIRARPDHRRRRGDTTGEEVAGDVQLLPHRLLDDGSAVVRRELRLRHHELLASAVAPAALPEPRLAVRPTVLDAPASDVRVTHGRRPTKAATPRPANTPAAVAARRHIAQTSRVGTTGSGGSP